MRSDRFCRRGRVGALGASVVLGLGSLLVTSPAQAIPQPCPDGAICFYDNPGGTGTKIGIWGNEGHVSWMGYYQFNDRTDSVINNTGYTWYWYVDVNYGGTQRTISPRKGVAQSISPANTLSSAKLCYCF